MEKQNIVYKSTSDLIPYIRNSRTHDDKQVAQIAASIKEFGFTNPVLIGDDNGIIAGHGRVLAARKLKLDTVPCIELSHLTDAQKKAYIISDNKLALNAGWNNEMLQVELMELQELDFDIDLIGFNADELALIMPQEQTEGLTDPDEVPEPPEEPVTVLGDVWILGNHRLMCGDSTSVDAVERLMNGVKADMVFTDPPYNTGMQAKDGSTRLSHMFDDKFTDEEWQHLLGGFVSNAYLFLKDNSAAYFCLDWRRNHELQEHLRQHFKLSNVIVWDKVVHGLGSDYKYTYELINVCKKGKPELDTHQGDREYSDVWHIQRKTGRDKDHATKKPIEIIERCLRHATKPNASVLDLFGGSGSTLLACEKINRHSYLMELMPNYVDVAITRWQNYTGKQAVLESTGATFDIIKNG